MCGPAPFVAGPHVPGVTPESSGIQSECCDQVQELRLSEPSEVAYDECGAAGRVGRARWWFLTSSMRKHPPVHAAASRVGVAMASSRCPRRETGPRQCRVRGGGVQTQPQTPPTIAVEVFGDRLDVAIRYAELLASEGVTRGLIGPREAERIWDRHILNCAAVASLIPTSCSVLDLGSGAGLPGLVVATLRKDLRVTLLEPLLRRTRFLDECVGQLALDNVHVERGRAEDFAGQVDVVLARAVAPLDRLAALALPMLMPGGVLLAMKGASVHADLAAAETALRRLGAKEWEIVEAGVGSPAERTFVVKILAGSPAAGRKRHPSRRRAG